MKKPEAIIIWGVSGSGKSSFAQKLDIMFHKLYGVGVVGIERDTLRAEILRNSEEVSRRVSPYDSLWYSWGRYGDERVVTNKQQTLYKGFIESQASCVVSDTNLRSRDRRRWVDLFEEAGYNVSVFRLDTPLEVCIERDIIRGVYKRVGEVVIRKQYKVAIAQPVDRTIVVPYNMDHYEFLENHFG